MASESGPGDSAVVFEDDSRPQASENPYPLPERLKEHPYDYRFFQAVRLMQAFAADGKPVGRFADPSHEAVRFASRQALSFPPSEIHQIEERPDGPPRMTVNFLGLSGPVGELPPVFTAHLMERLRARDRAGVDFLDIFNHRLTSLFYRAWEKHHFPVPYERGEPGGMLQYLLDLIGLGSKGLQDRQPVDDKALAYYSGLMAQRPRSAQALKQLLQDYFGAPVEVIQFVGAWRRLEQSSQCLLDDADANSDVSSQLGVGAVAGDEVWDAQSTVRLRIGPVPLARYLQLLPNGSAYPALKAMIRFFAGLEFDFDIQLVLEREDAPGCCLGAEGESAPQLGWLTWIKSVPMDRDPEDTVYRLREEA